MIIFADIGYREDGYGRHATRTMLSEGDTKSRGGDGSLQVQAVRDLGEVNRIRLLETELEELKATNERNRRDLRKQMETVKSQENTIETIVGDRSLLLAKMRDQEATWMAQRTEFERMVRLGQVEIERRNTEIRNLRTEHEKESRRRSDSENRTQALEKAWREAQEDAERERGQLKDLKREFAAMERRVDATTKLLNTRTEELDAAQAFLTTADECSGADFSRMVEQLNNDISHCGVLMADAVIEPNAVGDRLGEGALEMAFDKLNQFGWTRAEISRLHHDILVEDTILFEAMVQNILIFWCYRLVSSFSYDNRTVDGYFQELWDGIVTSSESFCLRSLRGYHLQLSVDSVYYC
jgi:hypothetical protein